MKTSEEIKKGLENAKHVQCMEIASDNENGGTCYGVLVGYVLRDKIFAYIQQLESRLAQVERERDAAVRAISDAKHYIKDLGAISYGLQQLENWDYSIKKSGVFEENTKEEEK